MPPSLAADKRSEPNRNLQLLLEIVGWRPETLARRVNARLAQFGENRRVHEKTPYRWINRGEVPHRPVPDVVVMLLAEMSGEAIGYEDVWPRGARASLSWVRADHGLRVAWTHAGLLCLLEEWSHMLSRRKFIALTGTALTGPAWEWMDAPVPSLTRLAPSADTVSEALLSVIDDVAASAQKLDDQHGSAATTFVADQFAAVSHLLRRASYNAVAGKRLCTALAQLAQTSGWMAHDHLHDGEAQRWYLAGLHAAHCAGDHALAASILALMSNQAGTLDRHDDAVQLAAAAQEAAHKAPPAVRALITARSGLAYAGAGDLTGFLRAREQTLTLLGQVDAHGEPAPRWASYATRTELDAIAGRGMVMLAQYVPGRRHQRLLSEAETLLQGRALSVSPAHQRSTLRHSAWLGLAYVRADDLDRAIETSRIALNLLPAVTSGRCVKLVTELRDSLASQIHRAPKLRSLITQLDRHLSPNSNFS